MLTMPRFMERVWFLKQKNASSSDVNLTMVFSGKSSTSFSRYTIRLCYEACYIGYLLCRFLRKHGIHCDVIAPSLIPVKTGTRVKTDRLDAAKLAEYYAKSLLTPIYIPDETDEEVRDILRSRNFRGRTTLFSPIQLLSSC